MSLLLAMLRQSDDDGFARVERAREVIEYDELLPRLWRQSWIVPVGYLLGLISMWARDQWVFFVLSLALAGFSLFEGAVG